MKKNILSILFYFIFFPGIIISQQVEWANADTFSSYVTHPNLIIMDNNGNIFSSAIYRVDYGDYGTVIIKYDKIGTKQWEKKFPGYEEIRKLTVDTSGNVYGAKGWSFFKLDVNGNLLWNKTLDYGISLGKNFNYKNTLLVSGYIYGPKTLPGNVFIQPSSSSGGYFIGKIDTSGKFLWAKADEGEAYNYQFNETGFYVRGSNTDHFAKYDTLGNLVWSKNIQSSLIAPDEYGNAYIYEQSKISKYDPAGNLLWQKTNIYVSNWYQGQLSCGNNGNLYISGGFVNNMNIGDSIIYGDNHYHTFVAKLDSAGTLKWVITSKGTGSSGAKDIIVSGNEIFVTGDMWGENIFGSHTVNEPAGVFTIKITDNDFSLDIPKPLKKNNELEVYPNPAGGIFQIKYSTSEKEKLNLNILDSKGKLVYAGTFQGDYNKAIDLGLKARGIYFIEIISPDKKQIVRKIVLD